MIVIKQVQYVSDYKIHCTFSNGEKGIVDCEKLLCGPIFEEIKDVKNFQQFRLDPITETIVWQNDADFAPEFLYDNIERNVP